MGDSHEKVVVGISGMGGQLAAIIASFRSWTVVEPKESLWEGLPLYTTYIVCLYSYMKMIMIIDAST